MSATVVIKNCLNAAAISVYHGVALDYHKGSNSCCVCVCVLTILSFN